MMWLIIVVALLGAGVLGSGTVRRTLLAAGFNIFANSLPGDVVVGIVEWPQLGHIQLRDLVWRDRPSSPDTLAHIALLDLGWDTVALRSRDVRVDSMTVVVSQVNVPAIDALLQANVAANPDSGISTTESNAGESRVRLRSGAIPGLPSLALIRWQVDVGAAVLAPDIRVSEVQCTGGFEAGYGREAGMQVHHLEARLVAATFDSLLGHPLDVSVPHLGLGLTLVAAEDSTAAGGEFTAVLDSLSLHFDLGDGYEALPVDRPVAWWQASGPGWLKNTAWVSRIAGAYRGRYECDFVLPCTPGTPPFLSADFADPRFDQVAGQLAIDGQYVASVLDFLLDVDLERTGWLDTGRLTARVEANLDELATVGVGAATVGLDTLNFSLLGTGLSATGSFRQGELDLGLQAAVTDPQLIAVLRPQELVDTSVNLDLDAQIGGTLQQPTVNLTLQGGFDSPYGKLPDLALKIDGDRSGGRADLILADGFAAAGMAADSLVTRIHVQRSAADSLSGMFSLGAWQGQDRIAIGGQVWADSLGRAASRWVRLDSLVIVGREQKMALEQPATLTLGPGPGDLYLTPLVFSGEAGQVSLGGQMAVDGFDLESQADFLLTESVLNMLTLSEFWSGDGGRDLSIGANVEMKGTREIPQMVGDVSARILPHRDNLTFGVDLGFQLASGDTAGLSTTMAIVANDSVVLRGHLDVPGGWVPDTGQWAHATTRPTRIVVPRQELGLSSVNRMLPPEVSVDGAITIGLAAAVHLGEVDAKSDTTRLASGHLEGAIEAPSLAIQLPNRSRLSLALGLQITGSPVDPVLGGRIEVQSGFFRIPEMPRSLLPVEGEPLLWGLATADTLNLVPDSLRVFEMVAAEGPLGKPAGPGFLPEMDLEIFIPGNLQIHGYGLDVELAGDLKVGRGFGENDQPQFRIHGEIHAVNGTLQFMNRVFDVDRGEIRFTGVVPSNPELDMILETDISGTIVRIVVSGRASEPVIEMRSEPDYEEQDIMAVLLFGRPLSELDQDQRGGVQSENSAGQELAQNLAGLAMALGTAGLQNTVSNTFGVDMVEVGADSEGEGTLMVGKFLNPKLMLKYHQSLAKNGAYFLTMEYALTQVLKIVSTYAQGEEDSGLELKWSRRY